MLDQQDELDPATAARRDQLVRVLSGHLPALDPGDDLDPDRPLKELGLTSMRAVDLLIDLEDELGIAFPDEELTEANFDTAASLWNVVARLAAAQGG